MSADHTPAVDTRFYGRRKGKRLKPMQEALFETLFPRLVLPRAAKDPYGKAELAEGAVLDPATLFPRPVRAVWLEIGYGGGEHMAAQAAANPDVGFIGAEPFLNGIGKLLRKVDERGLDNIRLYGDDVRPFLDHLPDACLEKVFLLFPDPWPKARHAGRRFVSPHNLDAVARLLVDGGEFRVASDDMTYVRWTLRHAPVHPAFQWTAQGPSDWRIRWPDAIESRYEAKAHRCGRVPKYLQFLRKPRKLEAGGTEG